MPKNISQTQKSYISSGIYEGEDNSKFELVEAKTLFEKYGVLFLQNLGKFANERGVVASGDLLSKSKFQINAEGTVMQIIVPDYFDYPNVGVKGVRSSKNAPKSPYQYKSYGMNADGRGSIKKYIESGHAKIETVVKSKDKALGIGGERKHLSLIDTQTNQLIYLIKRFGIKATNYFTDALNTTFEDFELKMSEAVGKDIVFTLEKLNR